MSVRMCESFETEFLWIPPRIPCGVPGCAAVYYGPLSKLVSVFVVGFKVPKKKKEKMKKYILVTNETEGVYENRRAFPVDCRALISFSSNLQLLAGGTSVTSRTVIVIDVSIRRSFPFRQTGYAVCWYYGHTTDGGNRTRTSRDPHERRARSVFHGYRADTETAAAAATSERPSPIRATDRSTSPFSVRLPPIGPDTPTLSKRTPIANENRWM